MEWFVERELKKKFKKQVCVMSQDLVVATIWQLSVARWSTARGHGSYVIMEKYPLTEHKLFFISALSNRVRTVGDIRLITNQHSSAGADVCNIIG